MDITISSDLLITNIILLVIIIGVGILAIISTYLAVDAESGWDYLWVVICWIIVGISLYIFLFINDILRITIIK